MEHHTESTHPATSASRERGCTRLVLRPSRKAPRRARDALAPLLPDERRRRAAMLAVSEAVTDALTHGHLTTADEIELEIEPRAERVRVTVRHPGEGFGAPAAADAGTSARDGAHWGLELIEAVSAAWGTARTPTHVAVWFEV